MSLIHFLLFCYFNNLQLKTNYESNPFTLQSLNLGILTNDQDNY